MLIHIAEDTYGAVERVEGCPIVTRFFAVSGFPIYPMDSWYLGRADSENPRAHLGIPCANLYLRSVLMAFFRGCCGVLILVGIIPIFFFGVMYFTEGLESDFKVPAIVGVVVSGMGTILGACSYLVLRRPSSRDELIRKACFKVFGVAADPANIRPDDADAWARSVEGAIELQGISEWRAALAKASELPSTVRDLLLLRVRLQLPLGKDEPSVEFDTDQIIRDYKGFL